MILIWMTLQHIRFSMDVIGQKKTQKKTQKTQNKKQEEKQKILQNIVNEVQKLARLSNDKTKIGSITIDNIEDILSNN